MEETKYEQLISRKIRGQEIYRLYTLEGIKISEIAKQFSINRVTVSRTLATFEQENPEVSALMKKQSKEAAPDDYKELQQELARVKKELSKERLRADFYQEMVAYGKEVYGIDLKKAGTK